MGACGCCVWVVWGVGGWVGGWLAGWLASGQGDWLGGRLAGWLAGGLGGWLGGCLDDCWLAKQAPSVSQMPESFNAKPPFLFLHDVAERKVQAEQV